MWRDFLLPLPFSMNKKHFEVLPFIIQVNVSCSCQATMPSTFKHPAHVPMWKGAKVAYFFIAMCLFPIAIGGFWAYGNLVSLLTYALYFLNQNV